MTHSDQRTETWKAIGEPFSLHRYQVSDMGQVRSLRRVVKGRTYPQTVLKQSPDSSGYPKVSLARDDGEKVTRNVHTLVLEAFRGPCPPGMEACHEDDDPTDNRLEKLRWDWPEGNLADRKRNHPVQPKPVRICVRCESNPVTTGGRRCHPCVVEVGVKGAEHLNNNVPLSKVCELVNYPSPEGLHTLARKYGGYAAQPPSWSQRVTAGVVSLRDRLRGRLAAGDAP